MPGEQHVSAVKSRKVIVAAAIITDGRVLACERSAPAEVAGRWEFPGGKVEPGETDEQALARECVEELGVRVEVGDRIGPDVSLAHGRAVLRVFAVTLLGGDQPQALEHTAMRWLSADELDSVPWLPADKPIVAALPPLLL
ncbi:DNA mismatch repair protein MutT [Paractinoplanes tereljensis]|uniref:8-oxo-dGTP diphosphatase n=1 Tax=Paractinoplanes tereljensis TaxID=571912 RepID=A0A919TXT0_9ACTN|nr:(deoxy)nucleoside triphosphate pyrophosphohydrolase [Actinoplanes tereljensis]GIF24515.1 DNA mismatch repair protein MutT [Actinoplanes tereljensis]